MPFPLTVPADVSGEYFDWTKTLKPETPWQHDYSQSLVMKLFLCNRDSQGQVGRVYLTFEDALQLIKRLDAITFQIPKIAYLVGWQYNGHDSKYPSWDQVNSALKRPQDKSALDSLKWVIREARKYHTDVSLHVNMIDAYKDSPLWQDYFDQDIIAKDQSGNPIPGETFDGIQSYQISYAQEWRKGRTQKRIDNLIKMLPELKKSGTIHLDAFHSMRPSGVGEMISPYLGISTDEEVATQRKIFRYFRKYGIDATCEGGMYWLRRDPFVGLQPMAWHFHAENFANEDWLGKPKGFAGLPPQLYCGTPFNTEVIAMKDPVALPEYIPNVCLKLAPWYLRNRVPQPKGVNAVVEDRMVFCPALWTKNLILAYSADVIGPRKFQLPDSWPKAKAVKVSHYTLEGELNSRAVNVDNSQIEIEMRAGQALTIRPVR
ncbi:MAG: hypothetical protein JST40_00700 [Armatimonadetes bacterium]|nr:hypothetical protein [Armatimonadota bacterium]